MSERERKSTLAWTPQARRAPARMPFVCPVPTAAARLASSGRPHRMHTIAVRPREASTHGGHTHEQRATRGDSAAAKPPRPHGARKQYTPVKGTRRGSTQPVSKRPESPHTDSTRAVQGTHGGSRQAHNPPEGKPTAACAHRGRHDARSPRMTHSTRPPPYARAGSVRTPRQSARPHGRVRPCVPGLHTDGICVPTRALEHTTRLHRRTLDGRYRSHVAGTPLCSMQAQRGQVGRAHALIENAHSR